MSEITLQIQIDELNQKIDKIVKTQLSIPNHFHTGIDTSKIQFSDISRKKVYISYTIYGADSATAANYGVFFIIPFACYITGLKEVHGTAGSDAGAVLLNIEKLTGTQALDAGVNMLSADLSLKATANTVQTGTLTNTLNDRNLAIGNRVALKDTGTLTAVANVSILLELQIK